MDKAVPVQRTLESERRQATVMFTDISGFTAMSERIDAEDITAILNECFDILSDIITAHGGYIDKYIGDCVMAVFGVPVAIVDAPARAIECAIALHEAIQQYNRERTATEPLDLHTGINSGMVISGNVGSRNRRDYTVIGDAVNLASRLEDIAETGQILVGSNTYELTKHQFSFASSRFVQVKGKQQPVRIYEVSRSEAKISAHGVAGKSSISSELVGRNDELGLLEATFQNMELNTGHIINIAGEAGVGKSRLISEFCDGIAGDAVILEARALSLGGNMSFLPITGLIKRWAGIEENDETETSFARLESLVKNQCPEELNEIVSFIGTLLGYDLPRPFADRVSGIEGDKLARLIALSVRKLLESASRHAPLVVIFEDVQWSDMSTIDLMDISFRLVSRSPIMFINSYRPGRDETIIRLIESVERSQAANTSVVALQPLGRGELTDLFSNLTRTSSVPPLFLDRLLDRSGGNPYFIEEVVRSLIDSGTIDFKDGVSTFTGKSELLSVPNTIEEVIMARFDILDEETKYVLKIASVIGRTFFRSVITGVVPDVSNIDARLAALEELQILRKQQRGGETEYVFKHALAQEAIYNSILTKTKNTLHSEIARAIENQFRDRLHEIYGMLAYHYSLGDDYEKADEYLRKAGDQALQSSASNEALVYFQEALSRYHERHGSRVDPDHTSWLERCIALAYRNKGHHAEAGRHFLSALAVYGFKHRQKHTMSDSAIEAWFFIRTAVFLAKKHPVRGRVPTKRERELFELLHDVAWSFAMIDSENTDNLTYKYIAQGFRYNYLSTPLVGQALSFELMGIGMTGKSLLAGRLLRRVFRNYVENERPTDRFMADFHDIGYAMAIGDWSCEYDSDLVRFNLEYGQFQAVNCYLFWHGMLRIEKGDVAGALEIVNFSNEICDDYENDEARLHSAMLNARYCEKTGDFETSLEHLNTAIAVAETIGLTTMKCWCLGTKLHVLSLLGEIDDAATTRRQIADMQLPRLQQFASSVVATGELAFARAMFRSDNDSNPKIGKVAAKARRIARTWSLDQTEILRMIGNLYADAGNTRKAMKWFMKSARSGEQLGAMLELSQTCFDIAPLRPEYRSRGDELLRLIKLPPNLKKDGDRISAAAS